LLSTVCPHHSIPPQQKKRQRLKEREGERQTEGERERERERERDGMLKFFKAFLSYVY
jgi:hypothetical protein